VRDLFEQAKKIAPAIVFIDEIDAVGRQRGAGLGGGHDEREQTLNALLVEMDGFEQNTGVIIIAATNRPDVLDPALLRPGRFDRQIVVDRPDRRGREGILKVHTRNVPLAENVDLMTIAKATPGFSGADLANLCNEAAIYAARRNGDRVTMFDFEMAKDKLMMGLERRTMVMSDDERRMTAYHEVGHVLVGKFMPHGDPVHKVTIIPRGRALGVTAFLPDDDRHSRSREWFEAKIAMALGGRAAELLIFGNYTSGAQGDIKQITSLARQMVCEFGMSERLGPVNYASNEGEVFLGRDYAMHKDISEETARLIDEEVRRIIDEGMHRAADILKEHMDLLHAMAALLIERETLDADEIDMVIRGEELPPLEVKRMVAARMASGQNAAPKTGNGQNAGGQVVIGPDASGQGNDVTKSPDLPPR
jgi:cell division protease FtsH